MKTISRRNFLGNSSLFSFVALGGIFPFLKPGKKKKDESFVHHVFFWLRNPDSAEDRKKLEKGLKSLKAIETIRKAHIGVPAKTDRPVIESSYDFSELLIFDSLEDQQAYQVHPVHLKFVEECEHLWSKVIVYDSVDI